MLNSEWHPFGDRRMEKEEGIDAEAEEAEAFRREASSSFPLGCSPFEACIMLERDSGQKKPLEMNGA